MSRWHLLAFLLAGVLAWTVTAALPSPVAAQLGDDEPDSAAVDSTEAQDDLFGTPAVPRTTPGVKGRLAPKAEASVTSNVTSITVRGGLEANVGAPLGSDALVRYAATNTTYRQQDRDTEARDFSARLSDSFGSFARLSVDFRRNTNFDENRVGTGSVVLELENANATLKLDGGNRFTDGFRHHWAVRGDFEDAKQTNRGVDNNRSLAGAGFTSLWKQESRDLDLSARYGYQRSSGTRQVRGLDDDATAERDTLGAKARVDLVPRLNLTVEGIRTSFVEQRLDFARNSSGVVDTASTAGPKVSRERESTRGYDVRVTADSRPLPRLHLSGTARADYAESEYTFSRQGFLLRGNDQLQGEATFRYAEAGSLQVTYTFSDRYNDRRTQSDAAFRGRESAKAYGAEARLKQALFFASSLDLSAKQTLDQNFFQEQGNLNDRDRLFERFDAGVKSTALPWTTIDVGGTLSRTEDLAIAADRVGDNKEERLIEVRGAYTVDPPGGFRLAQTYRLQIRYIDYFLSDDRDQFNKQGQLNTQLDYELPLGADLGVDYVLDYRRTGTRDLSDPYREIYVRDQRRFDHRLTARFGAPLRGFKLDVRAERGFLREERGIRDTNEDRGQLSTALSGNRRLWSNRATLKLDVERVLQFGPRVRDEQKDYWVANTSLAVQF